MEAHVELWQGDDIIWNDHSMWRGTVCFRGMAVAYDIAARIQPHPEGCWPVGTP
jgi:hypothetical protein